MSPLFSQPFYPQQVNSRKLQQEEKIVVWKFSQDVIKDIRNTHY
jgi:hypothetical protein